MITIDVGLGTLLEKGLISLRNYVRTLFRRGHSRKAIEKELSRVLEGKDFSEDIEKIIDDAERDCRDPKTLLTTRTVRKMHTGIKASKKRRPAAKKTAKRSGKKSAKKASRKMAYKSAKKASRGRYKKTASKASFSRTARRR